MSEPRSLPAEYDPGRGPKGRFAPGNKISTGWSDPIARKFQELQAAWLDCCTAEQQQKVNSELVWLTQQRDNLEVKIKSIVYYQDRNLGKPRERIDLDVSSGQQVAPVISLTATEVEILEKLVVRAEEGQE